MESFIGCHLAPLIDGLLLLLRYFTNHFSSSEMNTWLVNIFDIMYNNYLYKRKSFGNLINFFFFSETFL